jgi:hypothetical protein
VADEVIFDEDLPFYDLSVVPGVRELPRVQDGFSPPIPIPGVFVYGSLIARTIYVSTYI